MRLVIENGKIEFAGHTLIENINFEVTDNSKIAIIGKNGCGKTSLLKVISNELEMTFDSSNKDGYINKSNDFSIGCLKQISFYNEEMTLEDAILECYKDILDKKKELEILENKLQHDTSEEVINEYSRIYELFENMGGYYYQKEYHMILKKFGFQPDSFSKKIKEFSGGERTKIAFIKLLLNKPDLLLLDEPTNHLDLEAIEWLEEYLKSYKKAFIVISHDREFINRVAKVVYEIEYNTITKYSGNYDDYLKEKETRYKSLSKQYNEQQKEIAHQQELIERFRYKATKAKMVQSRIKQLEKMDIIQPPKKEYDKSFRMNINPLSESGKDVLTISDLSIGYSNSNPLSKISLTIKRGDKIAVIGENGSGKSTLLKTIIGQIEKLNGDYRYGFNVKIGYFDQQIATKISDKTIIQDYKDTYPHLDNQQVRNDLGAFLFSGADVDKKLSVLSGGEMVRFGLCKLLKTRPNFLILDEPTNHMDIYCKEAIERMLKSYKGTIFFVSHDRYFVRKIANSIVQLGDREAKIYPYGYEQFLEKKDVNELKEKIIKTYEKQKKVKSTDMSSLKKEISKLEIRIKEKEEEIKKINDEFEKEEVYSDFMITRELEEKLEDLEDELEGLMRNWDELVNLLEEK